MKKEFRSFKDARKFVQNLGLKSQSEYRKWWKENRPKDLPSNAPREYKNKGWTSWGGFLGSGFVSHQYRSYKSFGEAKKIVRTLRLKSQKEFNDWWRKNRHNDFPSQPQKTYKNKGWTSWGDFLGSGFVATGLRQFKSFDEAREFVRELGIMSLVEYREWWKENTPKDLPANPPVAYKGKGWTSWGDFLGTGFIYAKYRKFKPFEEARKIVRKLGLKSSTEFTELCKEAKIPKDIPAWASRYYKKQGWISWGDFLGTGFVFARYRPYKSFDEARTIVRKLGLKNRDEYDKWYRKNKIDDIPINADQTYKNKGWTSWGDFLDSGFVAPSLRQFKSFDESRTYVRTLKLLGKEEYSKWAHSPKRPLDIPSSPSKTYQKKWIGWGDWLGTGTIAPQTIHKNYLPFKEAKDIARELAKKYNLKTFGDWEIAVKEGKIPKNIPLFPQRIYSKKRKK